MNKNDMIIVNAIKVLQRNALILTDKFIEMDARITELESIIENKE